MIDGCHTHACLADEHDDEDDDEEESEMEVMVERRERGSSSLCVLIASVAGEAERSAPSAMSPSLFFGKKKEANITHIHKR